MSDFDFINYDQKYENNKHDVDVSKAEATAKNKDY